MARGIRLRPRHSDVDDVKRLAPFVPDMVERASKSFIIGESTYIFQGLISTSWVSWEWSHATEFGVGSTIGSICLSWASRYFVLSWRWPFFHHTTTRTTSLVARVEYAAPA